jgi:hypothetical protein
MRSSIINSILDRSANAAAAANAVASGMPNVKSK